MGATFRYFGKLALCWSYVTVIFYDHCTICIFAARSFSQKVNNENLSPFHASVIDSLHFERSHQVPRCEDIQNLHTVPAKGCFLVGFMRLRTPKSIRPCWYMGGFGRIHLKSFFAETSLGRKQLTEQFLRAGRDLKGLTHW